MDKEKKYRDTYRKKAVFNYRDDNGDIVIPAGVSDKSAYLEYVKVHEALINDPQANWQTSDPELCLVLTGNIKYIKEKIRHLPDAEKRRIIRHAEKLMKLKGLCSKWKRKAFNADKDASEVRKFNAEAAQTGIGILNRRSAELIELFGRFFTLPEVHRIVVMEWGYDIALMALSNFRSSNIDKIKERQEEFKRDYSDVRLGHKRSRLDELSYLYGDRKELYKSSHSINDSREMRAILEQVRKEIEGDVLTIDGNLHIEHDHRVQMQITSELLNGMSLKALIIARVAAKLGRDPLVLQARLLSSYYARFNGFQPAEGDVLTDEILYPSTLIYDFDVLRDKNKMILAEDAKIVEPVTVPADTIEKASDMKSALLKRLIEQRSANNQTVARIEDKGFQSDK